MHIQSKSIIIDSHVTSKFIPPLLPEHNPLRPFVTTSSSGFIASTQQCSLVRFLLHIHRLRDVRNHKVQRTRNIRNLQYHDSGLICYSCLQGCNFGLKSGVPIQKENEAPLGPTMFMTCIRGLGLRITNGVGGGLNSVVFYRCFNLRISANWDTYEIRTDLLLSSQNLVNCCKWFQTQWWFWDLQFGGSVMAIFSAEGAYNYTIALPNPASASSMVFMIHELQWGHKGKNSHWGPWPLLPPWYRPCSDVITPKRRCRHSIGSICV